MLPCLNAIKDILYRKHRAVSPGSYLEELLPVMIARKKSVDLLKFLADMTKNNATYIDTQLLCAVFRECYYPNKTQPIEEVSRYC